MAITNIQINNNDLVTDVDRGYLNADIAAGSGTITVTSINKFGVNQILLLGELGSEKSEIVKTHASTAPTGNTVTLAANTVHDHTANTAVYIMSYDQYELSHAPTATGTKTLLTTTLGTGLLAVDPEVEDTLYKDTEYSSGFYFVRKKDSINGTFSGYSDAIPAAGFDQNTVGYMVEQALKNNLTELSEQLTLEDCIDYINTGLSFVQGKQVRFPEHQQLNYVAGQTTRGENVLDLPTDIYDSTSGRSIVGIRIGDNGESLMYKDPKEFESLLGDTLKTEVRTEAVATDTSLAVDNSYDFADSGTVNVYISGVKHSISYTGVTRSTTVGALTGIPASGDGSITVTIPVDTNVWQNENEGTPRHYTVRNGAVEVYPLADAQNDNMNVYLDYFTVVDRVDSDGDTIDLQRFDMILDYLSWRIRMKVKNDGALNTSDGYYDQFKEKMNDAIRTSRSPFKYKMAPKINRINYGGRSGRYQYESPDA